MSNSIAKFFASSPQPVKISPASRTAQHYGQQSTTERATEQLEREGREDLASQRVVCELPHCECSAAAEGSPGWPFC